MKNKQNIAALVVIVMAALSCSMTGNSETRSTTDKTMAKDSLPVQVKLQTDLGDIVVELYDATPAHRDNFVKLVNEGYYDGVLWHRVIKDFMVQTGDGDSKTAKPGQMLGSGDPGYTLPAEFVYPRYFHKRGALSAARTGDQVNPERRSSGSQFYIVTGKRYSSAELKQMANGMANMAKESHFRRLVNENRDRIMQLQQANDQQALSELQNDLIARVEAEYAMHPFKFTDEQIEAYTTVGGTPHLDNQYTVFGQVVSGMDVVDRIQQVETDRNDRPVNDIKIVKATLVK